MYAVHMSQNGLRRSDARNPAGAQPDPLPTNTHARTKTGTASRILATNWKRKTYPLDQVRYKSRRVKVFGGREAIWARKAGAGKQGSERRGGSVTSGPHTAAA